MSLFVWSFILFGVIIGAFVVVALVRRQFFIGPEDTSKEGFTIGDLRQLRESGQMSTEEFEKARAALVGQHMNRADSSQRSDKSQE